MAQGNCKYWDNWEVGCGYILVEASYMSVKTALGNEKNTICSDKFVTHATNPETEWIATGLAGTDGNL